MRHIPGLCEFRVDGNNQELPADSYMTRMKMALHAGRGPQTVGLPLISIATHTKPSLYAGRARTFVPILSVNYQTTIFIDPLCVPICAEYVPHTHYLQRNTRDASDMYFAASFHLDRSLLMQRDTQTSPQMYFAAWQLRHKRRPAAPAAAPVAVIVFL